MKIRYISNTVWNVGNGQIALTGRIPNPSQLLWVGQIGLTVNKKLPVKVKICGIGSLHTTYRLIEPDERQDILVDILEGEADDLVGSIVDFE